MMAYLGVGRSPRIAALLQLKMHCQPYGIKGSVYRRESSFRKASFVVVCAFMVVWDRCGMVLVASMGLREVYHSVAAGSGRVEQGRQNGQSRTRKQRELNV